jgi:hypothetical protein
MTYVRTYVCVCVCVCMYVRMYVHMYVRIYVCIAALPPVPIMKDNAINIISFYRSSLLFNFLPGEETPNDRNFLTALAHWIFQTHHVQ